MKEAEISLYYETDTGKCFDYFGFADRHPNDLDGIDELMPTEKQFHSFMDALKAVSPAPIYFVEIPDESNGSYSHVLNEVVIDWRISPVMAFKTALHEMTHAILHRWPGGVKPADRLPRSIRETEAEGVAYLVCLHYGLDTSSYSIDYIHGWIRHLTDAEAEKSVERIRKTADELIAKIDAELENQT